MQVCKYVCVFTNITHNFNISVINNNTYNN